MALYIPKQSRYIATIRWANIDILLAVYCWPNRIKMRTILVSMSVAGTQVREATLPIL